MDNRGYQKALDCFERIWKEGLAEGKWQDDENLKILYYDWFVTGWVLRASEDAKTQLNKTRNNKLVLCYYGGVCRYPDGLCREDCPKHKENGKS